MIAISFLYSQFIYKFYWKMSAEIDHALNIALKNVTPLSFS